MNRALRRLIAHSRPPRSRPAASRDGTRLAAMPWKIDATWAPLDRVLARIEIDGTVETAKGRPVLYDDANGGWYEMAPAIDGLVDFHRIAAARHGWDLDLRPLEKLAAKLRLSSPLFEADLEAVLACADRCKRLAGRLTLAEAQDILQTVRISIALEGAPA